MRALVILARSALSWSVEIPATVASVADGDTIAATMNRERVKVRFLCIDNPESHDNRHGKAMSEGVAAANSGTCCPAAPSSGCGGTWR